MHSFWGDVFRRWPTLFETHYKKWKFWAGVLGAVGVAIVTVVTTLRLDQFASYWWVGLIPIILYALYALKLAIEEHYKELERKYVGLGDRLTSESEARRAERANASTGEHKPLNEHVSALGDYAVEGVGLARKVSKSKEWTDELNNEYRQWNKKVDEYVTQHFREFLSLLRHIPEPPTIKVQGRKYHQRSIHDLDHKVKNLHAIMERLENRG